MTSDDGRGTLRESSYLIGNCLFQVIFSNLVDVRADALVSSDDNYLTMGGGVSAALLRAGGNQISTDARKYIPLSLGDVAVTTAGHLPAKFIFHGVTLDHDTLAGPDADCLRRIVANCLALAEALRLRHIAFPALGTGVAGFPFARAADVMTRQTADFLSRQPAYLNKVTLVLFARDEVGPSDLDLFYERAVGLAAQWTDSRQLRELIDKLEQILARTDAGSLTRQVRNLRQEIAKVEATLAEPANVDTFVAPEHESPLQSASVEARDAAVKSAEVLDWEDVEARETVLKLRLQSLRTQHNILIGNRNQLEERKAKYGPHAVPLEVENALVDIMNEIVSKEGEVREVKTELAHLGTIRSKHNS